MSKKLIEMVVIRKLILLLQRGMSERNMARELNISRATVRRYLQRIPEGVNLEELLQLPDEELGSVVYPVKKVEGTDPRIEDFESRKGYFFTELPRTGVTRQLLWQEYKRVYPEGFQYSRFCSLLAGELRIRQATMANLSHPAGELMEMDFAGDPMWYFDHTGKQIFCPVFIAVLPFSGYSYVCALPNGKLEHLVKALNDTLMYFGGAPLSAKSDNMKQVVSKSCIYEPTFTQMMDQWAVHNRIALLAARVRRPKDKPHVEGAVHLAYLRVYAPLRDQVFHSLAALNAAILKQLEEHHHKPFQKKDYTRYERYISQEKAVLQPLGATAYAMKHYTQAKVQKNYHITLGEDWHHYSVPFRFIGQRVKVIYDADWVEIYLNLERIAIHRRSYKSHGYSTVEEHRTPDHRLYTQMKGWDGDYFLSKAAAIGTYTHQYVEKVLQSRRFTEQTFNGCMGILRLASKKTVGSARMEAACKRALQGDTFNYKTIERILMARLDQLDDLAQPDLFQTPDHPNVRGADHYT